MGWRDVPTYEPIFGKNKTLLPFVVGPLIASVVCALYLDEWFLRDGCVIGFCTIAGDHIKSAAKRLLGIPPGAPWFFDRIDFAIGGGLGAMLVVPGMTWLHLLFIVAMAYPVHFVGNQVSYRLGWRKTPH